MQRRTDMTTVDFSRSYIRFRVDQSRPTITVTHVMPTTVNNVRIAIESRCELRHLRTGEVRNYVLGASCKTERVGAERDCWLEPNADFCLAASDEEFLIFKSWAHSRLRPPAAPGAVGISQERQSGRPDDAWSAFSTTLSRVTGQVLHTIDDIIAAIWRDRPLVGRTVYDDGDYQVTLEYPIKTINYSERERIFQTDTGPILLPDLTAERLARGSRPIDCFDLAYSAFNSAGWTEFIVNVPTLIGDGLTVNHYSRPRRIEPVRNLIFECLTGDELAPTSQFSSQQVRSVGLDGVRAPARSAASDGAGAK